MHEVVTNSTTATDHLFSSSSEDLLSPISITTRPQGGNTLGWSQTHEYISEEGALEVCLLSGATHPMLTLLLKS
jgi:hypothetical protein